MQMHWLNKLLPPKIESDGTKASIPEGLWRKCNGCNEILYHTDLDNNLKVCPKCNHHHQVDPHERFDQLLDKDGRVEIGQNIKPVDILGFVDSKSYAKRLQDVQSKTGENDALKVMIGAMGAHKAVVAVFDFRFIGGSMGSVVGHKFMLAIEESIKNNCAFICVSASGGARMQEGLNSLMQMTKTCASLTLLAKKQLPFISVLTNPTMGGVSASFAFLGDIVIAEPKALIGFAGPRVIEQTVRQKLPEGFQSSEFLLTKGAIDMVVNRQDLRSTIIRIIDILM